MQKEMLMSFTYRTACTRERGAVVAFPRAPASESAGGLHEDVDDPARHEAAREDGDQEDQRRVREGVRRPRSADWATRQSARGVVPM